MVAGDKVSFRHSSGSFTVIGEVVNVDGDKATVKEISAASIWGYSDGGAGEEHSVATAELKPWTHDEVPTEGHYGPGDTEH